MRRTLIIICIFLTILSLSACQPSPTPQPSPVPDASPSASADVTAEAAPTELGGAPEAIFTEVGSTATLSGQDGIEGKAVVAGLQTLIILGFRYDGKVKADLRLVQSSNPGQAVHILSELDRAYDGEVLQFSIPAELTPGSADTIAVYAVDSGQILAQALFQ